MPAGVTGTNYNGIRWFDGPSPQNNEVRANPTSGACGTGGVTVTACAANGTTGGFNNAGQLAGVTTVYQPLSLNMYNREYRNIGEALSTVTRAADFNVYWGTGGVIDSVIDITHNVLVPFQSTDVDGGWGILNTANQGAGGFDGRPTVVTTSDFTCVEPLRSGLVLPQNFWPCTAAAPFTLSNTAQLGAIAFGSGNNQSATATLSDRNPANIEAEGGFFMYLAGTISGFSMPALPAAGTVWSLRTYSGIIYGGNGTGQSGNRGPYSFVAANRNFTALGATMGVQYDVVNDFNVATSNLDLSTIHTVPDPYYVTDEYEVGLHVQGHQVREPPAAGDDPHLLVERGAGPGAELRGLGKRRHARLERPEPEQPGRRQRCVLLSRRIGQCAPHRAHDDRQLRQVATPGVGGTLPPTSRIQETEYL